MSKTIFVVDGARTPFLKARNAPGPFSASDLAVAAGRALLARQRFAPGDLDEVILGCAAPSPDETNIGRVVSLRMNCGQKVPGWTVMRNCASGMQAIDSAIMNIQSGRSTLVMAGGVDALSRAPLLYSEAMTRWFAAFASARTLGQRAAQLMQFKLRYLAPVIGIMKGLTDPVIGQIMGQRPRTSLSDSASTGVRWMPMPCAVTSGSPRRRMAGGSRRSCRWSGRTARSIRRMMACVVIHRWTISPSCGRSSTASTAT